MPKNRKNKNRKIRKHRVLRHESLENRIVMTGPTAELSLANQTEPIDAIPLAYSEAMDVSSVTSPSSYLLTRDGEPIEISSVQYDESNNAAELLLSEPLEVGEYDLEVIAASLQSESGEPYQAAIDLVTAMISPSFGKLPIRVNRGDLTYRTDTVLDSGRNLGIVKSGDLNGDGDVDFVALQAGRDAISLFLSDGAGGYHAAETVNVGDTPVDLAVGDLNADGRDDIAIANLFSSVSVLLSDDVGGFTEHENSMPGRVKSLLIGDFDEVGGLDIASSVEGHGVVISFNTGSTGIFESSQTYASFADRDLVLGDVDGDGRDDIVGASQGGRGIVIMTATTGSNFDVVEIDLDGVSPTFVGVGDFNGDDNADIAFVATSNRDVQMLVGDGEGGFELDPTIRNSGQNATELVVADMDNNGLDDVIISTGNEQQQSVISIFHGTVDGLGERTMISAGAQGQAGGVAVGEFVTETLVGEFTVIEPNNLPEAADDEFVVVSESSANVLDVLANDSDADAGDTLIVSMVHEGDQGGSFSIGGGGSHLIYSPAEGFSGVEEAVYVLSDGNGGESVATVQVTVTESSETLAGFRIQAVGEDGGVLEHVAVEQTFVLEAYVQDLREEGYGVFSAYVDLFYDDQRLQPVGEPEFGAAFPNGQVAEMSDGLISDVGGFTGIVELGGEERLLFRQTFEAIEVGEVHFSTDVADGEGRKVLLLDLDVPLGSEQMSLGQLEMSVGLGIDLQDDVFSTMEDSGPVTLDVLANDEPSGELELTGVWGASNGSVQLSEDGLSVVYFANEDFQGVDTFTYSATDAFGTARQATVEVTVNNVNDAPTAVDDIFVGIDEDGGEVELDVLANDGSGADEGEEIFVSEIGEVSPGGHVELTPGGDVLFTPDQDYYGNVSFDYVIDDGNGGTASATATIIVDSVNDAPTAYDDGYEVIAGASNVILDVLANDSFEPDVAELLTIISVGVGDQGGVATISPDGERLVYTPQSGFVGQDTFEYVISDGNGGESEGSVIIDVVQSWRNPTDPFDVNGDGRLTVEDPLITINELRRRGVGILPDPSTVSAEPWRFVDTSGDGRLTVLDPLMVINELREAFSRGEGESSSQSNATAGVRQTLSLAPTHDEYAMRVEPARKGRIVRNDAARPTTTMSPETSAASATDAAFAELAISRPSDSIPNPLEDIFDSIADQVSAGWRN